MQIVFTPTEAENHFYNALCNGLGHMESGYNLELTYDEDKFQQIRKELKAFSDNVVCYEDILMNILKEGGTLTLVDHESGMDPATISMKEVHERLSNTPLRHLMDAVNEHDDAETADVIIQTIFYNDVIFG